MLGKVAAVEIPLALQLLKAPEPYQRKKVATHGWLQAPPSCPQEITAELW